MYDRSLMLHDPDTGSRGNASRRLAVRTMPQLVSDDIRRQVVNGELKPGELLPSESALLEMYGVSRPTLREAMRILQAESLITTRRGAKGGVVIQAPDPEVVYRQAGVVLLMQGASLGDVYRARAVIEPPAARLLAEKNDPAVVAELTELIDQSSGLEDLAEGFGDLAGAFHRRVVELCGNQTLAFVAGLLTSVTDETYRRLTQSLHGEALVAEVQKAVRSWRKLVRLIEAGDGPGAEDHWRSHMAAVGRGWNRNRAA